MSYIDGDSNAGIESVKSVSGFWADGGDRSTSSEFSLNRMSGATTRTDDQADDDDNDSDGTETGRDEPEEDVIDEVGAQDAFVAGMIYALSRKMVPGHPYTPHSPSTAATARADASDRDKGRWRLEECLK
jgi:sugar/nucleoside kinase (ribokinase family)